MAVQPRNEPLIYTRETTRAQLKGECKKKKARIFESMNRKGKLEEPTPFHHRISSHNYINSRNFPNERIIYIDDIKRQVTSSARTLRFRLKMYL